MLKYRFEVLDENDHIVFNAQSTSLDILEESIGKFERHHKAKLEADNE